MGRDPRGGRRSVRVDPEDLLRHALVVGPSGAGKTTFLAHLARELVADGHGVTVIDPHGSLVRAIARALPSSRERAGLLFRISDVAFPIAINPLATEPGQEPLAVDELIEVLQRVQGREYWGPLLDLALRHAAFAAAELGGSLIETARMLDDPWFRGDAIPQLRNAETARFLGRLGDGPGVERQLLPAIHRLQRLLATPWLRNVLGQAGRGLDFSELFDRRSLALFDLSGVGTTHAKLIGSLLLLRIRQAALSRDPQSKPARHFVLVDESSWFLSRTVAELMDQARKFGVGLVLAVQRVGQLAPAETREAVLANAGTLLSFRVSDREEATFLGRHLGSERVQPSDLQRLPRYEAYAQLTHDGDRLEPAWMRAHAPAVERPDADAIERRLLQAARDRYARPRHVVEAELRTRERTLEANDEPEIRSLPVTPGGAVPAHSARPPRP